VQTAAHDSRYPVSRSLPNKSAPCDTPVRSVPEAFVPYGKRRVGGEWPRAISGSPETLARLLDRLAHRVGVDEVMIQQSAPTHEDALRSHGLLADGVGLSGR